jgi:hypothetical protein
MKALMELVRSFEPDCCFNLHDQRNIFAAGNQGLPATISFLAAASGPDRKVTSVRSKAMDLIVSMNELAQRELPGQVGRYTDEFYPRALGDNFHRMGVPCVLIESGAAEEDPLRSQARRLNFLCLLEAMRHLGESRQVSSQVLSNYQAIPQNQELFFDVIYRQARLVKGSEEQIMDLALLADERPDHQEKKLIKYYIIKELGDLNYCYGLSEFQEAIIEFTDWPQPNREADFTAKIKRQSGHRYREGKYYEEH